VVMVGGPDLASVELRPAEDADAAFLFEVYAASRRDPLAPLGWDSATADGFLRHRFEAEQRDWRNHNAGVESLVVLRDGLPVGGLTLARNAHELRILDLTLLPEHCGRGIGTALIGELLREAARTGQTVRAHVERTTPAVNLFRRLGFLHAATRATTFLMEWTPRAPVLGV